MSKKGYRLDDREVEVDRIEGDASEHEGYCTSAYWIDTGIELDDDELQRLSDVYASEFAEENYVNAASDAYDRYKDSYKYGDD